MVRVTGWIADSAEIDRVKGGKQLDPIVWHHLAVLIIVITRSKIEGGDGKVELESRRGGAESLKATWHDLLSDSVAGDDGDFVGLARHDWRAPLRGCEK